MLQKKWLWAIKILPYTEKHEAERLTSQTEGGLVGFKMGKTLISVLILFFHNLDWISKIHTCRYCAFMTQAKQNLIPSVWWKFDLGRLTQMLNWCFLYRSQHVMRAKWSKQVVQEKQIKLRGNKEPKMLLCQLTSKATINY